MTRFPCGEAVLAVWHALVNRRLYESRINSRPYFCASICVTTSCTQLKFFVLIFHRGIKLACIVRNFECMKELPLCRSNYVSLLLRARGDVPLYEVAIHIVEHYDQTVNILVHCWVPSWSSAVPSRCFYSCGGNAFYSSRSSDESWNLLSDVDRATAMVEVEIWSRKRKIASKDRNLTR